MSKLLVYVITTALAIASNGTIPIETQSSGIMPLDIPVEYDEVECMHTGETTAPPWLQLDPPWDAAVQIPDVYNRPDQWLSMAVDANGRIYVCYQSPWGGTGALARYGTGLASSTNQGLTWDNRVWFVNNVQRNMLHPDIAISDNGKIWLWFEYFRIDAGQNFVPGFMRSRATCYNNPDSLFGVSYFAIPNRKYPEAVTIGNGHQFLATQWTVDQTGTANDSVWLLFTHDSTNFWIFGFKPSAGYPGTTTLGASALGGDTFLVHGVEFFDVTNNDWDVACFFDTLGSVNLYGWSTGNPLDDHYPSVFSTQNYSYIALQSDAGGGDQEIIFTYSTDYGQTWNMTLQNLTNDIAPETYPRLHGYSATVGVNYFYGTNEVFFNYSINNGQNGTWQSAPEIVTDGLTADTGYHACALLYTPAYCYGTWEDTRAIATDSIEILMARRVTPIAVHEKPSQRATVLFNVFPNPFKKATAITCGYSQPMNQPRLEIYDATGRIVRSLFVPSNRTAAYVIWDGRDNDGHEINAGVYFCRFEVSGISRTEQLIYLK